MRTCNAAALAKIQQEFGLEPINIVRVFWGATPVDYSDKAIEEWGVVGGLMELSGLENVITVNGNSTSTGITVKLNDSEGTLKQIIDTHDVHKLRVQILQWFDGRPKTDAFVLFDGQINTPMEWSEGMRTFTFSVVNIIENREFGFSFEEGQFAGIPANLVGVAWPIVFGNVLKVPSIQLTETPSAILAQGFAIVYDQVYFDEMNGIARAIQDAFNLTALYAKAATTASLIASRYIDGVDDSNNNAAGFNLENTFAGDTLGTFGASSDNTNRVGFANPADDIDTYNQYMAQYQQLQQQSNNYFAEVINLQHQLGLVIADYNEKKSYALSQVPISSVNFPRGQNIAVEIGGSRFNVRVDGTAMTILGEIDESAVLPGSVFVNGVQETETLRSYQGQIQKEKFKWIDGGTKIYMINQPMYYLAAFGAVTIQGVFAKFQGVTTLIPSNYYQISYRSWTNELGNTATATLIIFNVPLTSVKDAQGQNVWESDQIWCDITGAVAGYWSNIVAWSLANFTDVDFDPTTFLSVSAATADQPMNFYYDQRVNTLTFLKDLCFQARVSAWIAGKVMYFRYLPAEPVPVETIEDTDIIEKTLIITCTDTESLYTKLIGSWKWSHDQPEYNKVITRYNVEKYGILEQTFDYFAYNHVSLVDRSLAFWAIRLGTSWKRIKLQCFMSKLKIEANDPVTVNLSLVANVPVVGIVERAVYDSATNLVDMDIWLPVRWGENTPFSFAYPAAVSNLYGRNADIEAATGNPFREVGDNFLFEAEAAMTIQMSKHNPFARPINDFQPPPPDPMGTSTALTQVVVRSIRPEGFATANQQTEYKILPGAPVEDVIDNNPITTFGKVIEAKDGQIYAVGLLDSDKIVDVQQLQIHEDFKIPVGTVVQIVRVNRKWKMQASVWVKADA
jgi:hypothetical protein